MKPIIPQNATQKQCPQCKKYLPLTSDYFHRDKRSRIGFAHACKQCKSNNPKQTNDGTFANCEHCGKTFYRRPSRQMQRRCSHECRLASKQWRKPNATGKKGKKEVKNVFATITCQQCGQPFSTKKQHRKYCTRKCANDFNAEIRLGHKPLEDRHCVYCQKIFHPRHITQTFCSEDCVKDYRPPIRNFMEKVIGQRRTDIEAIVEKCLQTLNIEYIFEKRFGRYWVDFYLPTLNIAIECDGAYWHKNTKEEDRKRDAIIASKHHVIVLRFSCNQIKSNNIKELICQSIQDLSS